MLLGLYMAYPFSNSSISNKVHSHLTPCHMHLDWKHPKLIKPTHVKHTRSI